MLQNCFLLLGLKILCYKSKFGNLIFLGIWQKFLNPVLHSANVYHFLLSMTLMPHLYLYPNFSWLLAQYEFAKQQDAIWKT